MFLLTELPVPVSNGGRAKVHSLLSAVSTHHDCYVLAFDNGRDDLPPLDRDELSRVHFIGTVPMVSGRRLSINKLKNIVLGRPPSFAAYTNNEFIRRAWQACQDYEIDVICYDLINTAPLIEKMPKLPSIHSPNDATSRNHFLLIGEYNSILKKAYMALSAYLLRTFERKHYHRFDRIHVVARESADYLLALDIRLQDRLHIISMSVGGEYFLAGERPLYITGSSEVPVVLFSGNLSNPGVLNGLLKFIDDGLDIIYQAFPALRFVILPGGRSIEPLVKRKIRFPNMEIIPWVDDYRTTLAQSHVFIAPDTTGPGPKTRILQALAMGVPIVALKEALEGVPYQEGVHLFECANVVQMGERVVELLGSEEKQRQMTENARKLGLSFCSSEVVAQQWRALFEGMIK